MYTTSSYNAHNGGFGFGKNCVRVSAQWLTCPQGLFQSGMEGFGVIISNYELMFWIYKGFQVDLYTAWRYLDTRFPHTELLIKVSFHVYLENCMNFIVLNFIEMKKYCKISMMQLVWIVNYECLLFHQYFSWIVERSFEILNSVLFHYFIPVEMF